MLVSKTQFEIPNFKIPFCLLLTYGCQVECVFLQTILMQVRVHSRPMAARGGKRIGWQRMQAEIPPLGRQRQLGSSLDNNSCFYGHSPRAGLQGRVLQELQICGFGEDLPPVEGHAGLARGLRVIGNIGGISKNAGWRETRRHFRAVVFWY
jgi:hypothetical protein